MTNQKRLDEGVACEGYRLDILVNDPSPRVREKVAHQGYGLDILVHDKDYHVRCAVAKQGFGLDILVHDDNEWVLFVVIEQGYGFDILIHNDNPRIRADVVEHCKDSKYLEIALYDESLDVREAVARRYCGLDILKNDENSYVANVAKEMLNKQILQSLCK